MFEFNPLLGYIFNTFISIPQIGGADSTMSPFANCNISGSSGTTPIK